MAFEPMLLFIITTIVTGFYILRGPFHKTPIIYAAFVITLAAFIYTTIVMTSYLNSDGRRLPFSICTNHAFFVVYGIYLSFTFVPGSIAFDKLS
jgi:Ca2+/H+ antiporter